MWYIFPQLDGLGFSSTSRLYSIKSMDEAASYLNHPILGYRLVEITRALLMVKGRSAEQIFGFPDNKKIKSCMTLFDLVSEENSIFKQVLDQYFEGEKCPNTLKLIDHLRDACSHT
jgi:uncharacterized protein (DUF1810 family)